MKEELIYKNHEFKKNERLKFDCGDGLIVIGDFISKDGELITIRIVYSDYKQDKINSKVSLTETRLVNIKERKIKQKVFSDFIKVDYKWIVQRQWGLNQIITNNQINDPKGEDIKAQDENLINLGAVQIISEIIEKFPPSLINSDESNKINENTKTNKN